MSLVTFTVFCTDAANERGTMWIDYVAVSESDNPMQRAMAAARAMCARDWSYDIDDVRVIGVAEGDVNIIYWED